MDIDLLRSFVAIADTGSFTLAAERVGRTQSAVSQQVRRLEDSLGRRVFERTPGHVTLTDAGMRLLPHARAILAAHQAAIAEFEQAELSGTIALGVPESFAGTLLPRTLPQFMAKHPGVQLTLRLQESPTLLRMLREGALDLSFVTESEVEGLGGPRVHEEPVVWIAPVGQPVERRVPLPVVAWREGTGYRAMVASALERAGLPFRIAVSTQGLGGMLAAVAAGLGVAAVARSQAGGFRILDPGDAGLPPLPVLALRLERAAGVQSALARQLERHLRVVLGV